MLFLTAILIYIVIAMTTMFFTILQWDNFLDFCLTFTFSPDFSLTTLKFSDYSRFSRISGEWPPWIQSTFILYITMPYRGSIANSITVGWRKSETKTLVMVPSVV